MVAEQMGDHLWRFVVAEDFASDLRRIAAPTDSRAGAVVAEYSATGPCAVRNHRPALRASGGLRWLLLADAVHSACDWSFRVSQMRTVECLVTGMSLMKAFQRLTRISSKGGSGFGVRGDFGGEEAA